jgi:peroxiredoxin
MVMVGSPSGERATWQRRPWLEDGNGPPAFKTSHTPSCRYDPQPFQIREELPMTIQIGDRIPAATLNTLNDGVQAIRSDELFKGKTVVLFSVPGAFTPTCSAKHLPGYVDKLAELKAKGVDTVACMAVNDAFVMDAWAKSQNVPAEIVMLADGNASFARSLGLELDATAFGMGLRSKRFALVAKDGVVTHLHVEAPGEFRVSSAEAVLAVL